MFINGGFQIGYEQALKRSALLSHNDFCEERMACNLERLELDLIIPKQSICRSYCQDYRDYIRKECLRLLNMPRDKWHVQSIRTPDRLAQDGQRQEVTVSLNGTMHSRPLHNL